MRSFSVTGNLLNFIAADVHSISIQVADYEYFDIVEVSGGRYSDSKPLIYAQAILDDQYYKRKIGPLLYFDDVYPLDKNNSDTELEEITVNREPDILGVPPVRSFYVGNEYLANLENNPNSFWVKNRIPFIYNLTYQYKEDFTYLRNTVLTRYGGSNTGDIEKYQSFSYLLTKFPALPLGTYKSELIYRTPGSKYEQGYQIKYKNE